MIQAVQKDDDLLADIERAEPGDGVCIWWLGHSGFLIKSQHGTVLIDPYLSEYDPEESPEASAQYLRLTERCVDPVQLTGIDVIAITHNHPGHLDPDTLQALLEANPDALVVVPGASRKNVCEMLECELYWPLEIDAGFTIQTGGIVLHGIPAFHTEPIADSDNRFNCLGYVIKLGCVTLYHAGDTIRCDELGQMLGRYSIDVAMLPIGGKFNGVVSPNNLDAKEAASLAYTIGACLAVPCHYQMFPSSPETPDQFVQQCNALDQAHRVLRCGERIDIRKKKQAPE